MVRRLRLQLLSLALVFLSALPAGAVTGRTQHAELEALSADLEKLYLALVAGADSEPTFKNHGNGLYSLSIELTAETAQEMMEAVAGKPLTVLAAGHQVSTPAGLSNLVTAISSQRNGQYNLWWVALNLSQDPLTRKTIDTVKGPGPDLKRSNTVTYGASSMQLFWLLSERPFEEDGLFTRKVKITGGGFVKYKCWAD